MRIFTVVLGVYEENCYVIAPDDESCACIIDPGDEAEKIKDILRKERLEPLFIIDTHGHIDHIGMNHAFNVPIYIHEADNEFLSDPQLNLSAFLGRKYVSPPAEKCLRHGDELLLGSTALNIIHTPGHTPGSMCIMAGEHLFSGDTLFRGSVGRTDFPYGNSHSIIDSIKKYLMPLGEEVAVYPGHGEHSTIGWERNKNFFIANRIQ